MPGDSPRKSTLRDQIEKALEEAGLGKKFDPELPRLIVLIYRERRRREVSHN